MDVIGPHLIGAHASSGIIAGHYAGLWAVLHAAGTDKKWQLGELATAADVKERWLREWVGVMASSGILSLEEGMIISCRADIAGLLLPTSEPLSFFTSLEFILNKEPRIGSCFKNGGPVGCPYSEYPNFQEWMANWSNSRMIASDYPVEYHKLIARNLSEALEKGIKVVEPGCGAGKHSIAVAKKYPKSTVVAFDIDTEQLAKNRVESERLGLTNLTFVQADFCDMPEDWNNSFDYLTIHDCMHDLPDPAKAMAGIRRVLKKNGLATMEDINTSSDMVKQVQHPITTVLYNISLHHCMSVSLANGGVGLGACWGKELAEKMLIESGWKKEDLTILDTGMHALYIMQNGSGLQ